MKTYALTDFYEFPEFKWIVYSLLHKDEFMGNGFGIGLDETEGLWLISYSYWSVGSSISMEPILKLEEIPKRLLKVPKGLIEEARGLLASQTTNKENTYAE